MKFICRSDKVISQNDEDIHTIGVRELCRLYKVDIRDTQQDTRGVNYTWFELKTKYDGNYSLPDTIAEQCNNRWKPLWQDQIHRIYKQASFWRRLKFLFTKKI
jgi:hypothetical protein